MFRPSRYTNASVGANKARGGGGGCERRGRRRGNKYKQVTRESHPLSAKRGRAQQWSRGRRLLSSCAQIRGFALSNGGETRAIFGAGAWLRIIKRCGQQKRAATPLSRWDQERPSSMGLVHFLA
ncbi:hypothetical protein IF1G_04243 [Cordyceps javanica]|uniref:Uncharacterized protein n=1 Tax=Cordyceps javanica TaxID=43265 RepID=A0A545V5L5_9HYPO|nr:hypothetical protein IF1G_04243 [Cordyceps javanica]